MVAYKSSCISNFTRFLDLWSVLFFLLLSGVCLSCILTVHLDCINHNKICFASIEYELSMFGLEFDPQLMYLL
jgi:hypothetical protein